MQLLEQRLNVRSVGLIWRRCRQVRRPLWVADRPFTDTWGRASSRRSLTGHLQTLVLRRPGSAVEWAAAPRRALELRVLSPEFQSLAISSENCTDRYSEPLGPGRPPSEIKRVGSSLRPLEFHGTSTRTQFIQGLAVTVDAGWSIIRRYRDAFRIDDRAQLSIRRKVHRITVLLNSVEIADPPTLVRRGVANDSRWKIGRYRFCKCLRTKGNERQAERGYRLRELGDPDHSNLHKGSGWDEDGG
jgi:hypothetical protein